MCYLTGKVRAGGEPPERALALSDGRLAFTVKLSHIFWPVPVLRSIVEGGETLSPTVTAVFGLGFDKCYQLLQTKHPHLWNFSLYFYK